MATLRQWEGRTWEVSPTCIICKCIGVIEDYMSTETNKYEIYINCQQYLYLSRYDDIVKNHVWGQQIGH